MAFKRSAVRSRLSPPYSRGCAKALKTLCFQGFLLFSFPWLYSTTRLAAVRGQSDRNIRKLRKTIHKKLQHQMYDHLCGKPEHGLTLRERRFLEEYSKIARKQGKDAVIRRENKTKRRKKKNRP